MSKAFKSAQMVKKRPIWSPWKL